MTSRRAPARGGLAAWFRDATPRQWAKRIALGAVGALALLVLLIVVAYASVSLPPPPDPVQTTLVLDARGGTLAELFKDENRIDVPLRDVADVMEQAVVATEDRNFYRHTGLDPLGITRALVNDLRGRALQGGSTITQQLVKNTYLDAERSVVRKAKEAILAVKVEQQMDKREILERYLNTIYFGRGAYGVEKAAQIYFGKPAAQLQVPEAALLAGLIRAPESADPERHPDVARNRRAIVLNAMVRSGDLEEAQAEAFKRAPLGTAPRPDPNTGLQGSSAYFVAMVRQWAVREFGERLAFGGGLRIETTLDPAMQAAAEEAVTSILDREDDPTAALVSMQDDGAVLAMIGGRNFQANQTNMATNRRRPQAGSTFKPFVLAAALDAGIPVSQRYPGPARREVEFPGNPPYDVGNYGNEGFGRIDLVEATAKSVNTVYAQLAADVGLQQVADTARRLGIDSEIPVLPSMALGAVEVSPYEMTRAYLTFATRGQRVEPFFVRRVTRADGRVVHESRPERDEVFDERYADVMNHVLSQTIRRGTGRAAAIGRPAAGKTGTTNENTDAWFAGYTPRVATTVWMGYPDDRTRTMDSVHGRAVTGGSFPAQIWARYMQAALADVDTGGFEDPDPELLNAPQRDEDGDEDGGAESTTTRAPEETTTTSSIPEDTTTSSSVPEEGEPTTTTSSAPPEETTTTTAPTTTTTAPSRGGGP